MKDPYALTHGERRRYKSGDWLFPPTEEEIGLVRELYRAMTGAVYEIVVERDSAARKERGKT